MYFAIHHNNEWVDLSDDIVGSVTIQERIDQAFGSGSAQAITNKFRYNIPPYTLAHIGTSSTDYIQYEISSEATAYLSMPTYYSHQINIMSIESILECYVLGTKSFSKNSRTDYVKIQELCDLFTQKYGITFTINSVLENVLNQVGNEYIFGNGATLWSILLEICSKYDTPYKPTCSIDTTTNTLTIDIKRITDDYSLIEAQILNDTISQNSADYGAYLETEASNVVDRDSPITFKALTCRSDEVGLTEDNAKIVLPTNVESITSVNCKNCLYIDIGDYYGQFYTPCPTSHLFWDEGRRLWWQDYTIREIMTFDDWLIPMNGVMVNPFVYWKDTLLEWSISLDTELEITVFRDNSCRVESIQGHTGRVTHDADMSSRVLESDVWNGLSANNKTQYAVYSKGGNSIGNLNGRYSIWIFSSGNVFDTLDKTWCLEHAGTSINLPVLDDNSFLNISLSPTNYGINNNPTELYFDVTCVPITAPKIIDYKNGTPINENSYKALSRTYNNTANPIDFNKLIKNMDESNEQLGKPEITLEYDLTLPRHPTVGNRIIRNYIYYYLMSIQKTYSANSVIAQLNLCESYYKIADAIGVAYQFESTKYPINSIVTRPIFNHVESTVIWNLIHDNEYGIILELVTYYDSIYGPLEITRTIKRATVMTAGDDYYLYIEALDQYSMDTQSLPTSAAGAKREMRDIPYASEGKACGMYRLNFIFMQEPITKEMSEAMPDTSALTGKNYIRKTTNAMYIYKDARERLTFTMKVSKETE